MVSGPQLQPPYYYRCSHCLTAATVATGISTAIVYSRCHYAAVITAIVTAG